MMSCFQLGPSSGMMSGGQEESEVWVFTPQLLPFWVCTGRGPPSPKGPSSCLGPSPCGHSLWVLVIPPQLWEGPLDVAEPRILHSPMLVS